MCFRKLPRTVCIAYTLLQVALFVCSLSFFCPFWLSFPTSPPEKIISEFAEQLKGDEWVRGLWASCIVYERRCVWFSQNNFELQGKFAGWHKAAQGLYATGLTILIGTYVLASLHVCCRQWRESSRMTSILASLALLAVVFITSSLAVFGAYSAREKDARVDARNTSPKFDWGYFISVAGLLLALAAIVMLFRDGCRDKKHDGYRMAGVSVINPEIHELTSMEKV